MLPIRAITFDFWGTLYHDELRSNAERRDRRVLQIQSFFGARGASLTAQQVREALIGVENRAVELLHTRQASVTKEEIGRLLSERLGRTTDAEAVETLGSVVALSVVHHPPQLVADAPAVLEALQPKFRMAVICNTRLSTGEALRQVMGNDLVLEFFETQTFSDETRTAKPDARQFLGAIELMGVPPDEAVHVGDHELLDVQGAKAAGLRAVLIRPNGCDNGIGADAVIPSLSHLPAALEQLP